MRPRAKMGLTRRDTWLARYIPDPFKFFFSSEAGELVRIYIGVYYFKVLFG